MSALAPVGNTYSSYVKYYPSPPQERLLFAQYFANHVEKLPGKNLSINPKLSLQEVPSQGTWTFQIPHSFVLKRADLLMDCFWFYKLHIVSVLIIWKME